MEFIFNHEEQNVLKACGITEEDAVNLFERLNKIAQAATSASGSIEAIGKEFTTNELAFVIQNQTQREEEESDPLKEIVNMLRGGGDA